MQPSEMASMLMNILWQDIESGNDLKSDQNGIIVYK